MIEITHVETFGFEAAIRGMRNPYESHDKSDSRKCFNGGENAGWWCENCPHDSNCGFEDTTYEGYSIGKVDMELAKKLVKAGSEHRKFLRMIHVQCDVIAPRYWWAEMDKYKYVEANSSSTMHLITKRHLTMDDFSFSGSCIVSKDLQLIDSLNKYIDAYNDADKDWMKESMFRSIKMLLPEGFNQLRTIDTNYEALLSIYHQRKNHRLSEWRSFCKWLKTLPYMGEFLEEKDAD